MKEYFKNTWYMYVIIFVFCFMLFLYEPMVMYLSNTSDFWFGIGTMLKLTFLLFFIVFLLMVIGLNIIYFLNKRKDKKVFKIATIIMFVIFICSYIQGNYLVGNLPLLDGEKIEWNNYIGDWIISFVLWVVVIVAIILIIKKIKLNKMVKYSGYVTVAVFLMLSLSLFTKYITVGEDLDKGFVSLITYKNFDKYSSDKNFIIFLLDCVDSKSYYNRMKTDSDFKDMLKDFTYYPDAMSGHPATEESVPLVLTGEFYQFQGPLVEWSTEAYKNSSLFELMEKNNYELDVYEPDLHYNDKSATRITNVYNYEESEKLINKTKFWKQEIKYILFRYLPSNFKRLSKIEEMKYDTTSIITKTNTNFYDTFYDFKNSAFLNVLEEHETKKQEQKVFKFIHIRGAHPPFSFNKDYKVINNATYDDAIDSALTATKKYIDMLKENNLYDNSVIIVMADHGYGTEDNGNKRHNPILFVKGFNEKSSKMKISNKQVHFIDLSNLYKDLISGKKSSEVFASVPEKNRIRYYWRYKENKTKMIEFTVDGKAWEGDKLKETGKENKKTW